MIGILRIVLGIAAASTLIGCASTTTTTAADPPRPKGDEASLRREIAYSLVAHREWAAAAQPLIELSAQHPKDPEILTMLGTVYREQGLFEQADSAYSKAIRIAPTYAKAYAERGIERDVSGSSSDAALEDLRTAVRLAPGEGAYANNLGFALSVRGQYAAAADALRQGLEHDPLSRRMHNNLGFVYARMGQQDRARREFEHGGTLDEVENNVGFAYERAGDSREACAHYRAALTENPLLKAALENVRRVCPTEGTSPGRSP
jgi:Flp pilus assembly protein TadD